MKTRKVSFDWLKWENCLRVENATITQMSLVKEAKCQGRSGQDLEA